VTRRRCRAGNGSSLPCLYTVRVGIVLRLAINAAALWVANVLFDGVHIHGWAAYVIGALVLGLANAILKPVLTVLTLPLIILTLGVFYLVINIAMVALAEWIAPNFSIDGFWSYVGIVVVIWAVNWVGHRVLEDVPRRSRPRWI
jgi:putative membrane protein